VRVMVAAWAAPTHFYPMVPLAWALRAAGHDVRVVTQPTLVPAATRTGLPVVSTSRDIDVRGMLSAAPERRDGTETLVPPPAVCGVSDVEPYVKIAEATAAETLAYARAFRPGLVLYEPTTYVGPIVAAALGVPAVRHLWGIDYMQRFHRVEPYGLAGLCARLDLPVVETLGDLTIDPCPEGLQAPHEPTVPPFPRLRTRFLPYNGPAVLPDWLRHQPGGERHARPRVCLTWGTTGYSRGPYLETLRRVIDGVAGLDADVVVTLSPDDAAEIGPTPPQVRTVSMLALNLLLPTCDAIVAQGGLGTMMTAAALGVPALIIPQAADHVLNAGQLAATGAGHVLPFADATPETVREAARALLADEGTRAGARDLAADIARQASPRRAVTVLERLVATGSSGIAPSGPTSVPAPTSAPVSRSGRGRAPRVLVTLPRWSTGTGTAMIPYARALRVSGCDVVVAATPEYGGPAIGCGLPVVRVGTAADPAVVHGAMFAAPGTGRAVEVQLERGLAGIMGVRARMELPEADQGTWARGWKDAYVGAIRGALAASSGVAEDTVALAKRWGADLVVAAPNAYAGQLAAAVTGVPCVRHLTWSDQTTVTAPFEQEALAPMWERYGAGTPDVFGDLTLDPCPLAIRLYGENPRTPIRWVPYAGAAGPVPTGRPVVAIAAGSAPGWPDAPAATLDRVLSALAGAPYHVLALASARDREALTGVPDNARLLDPALLSSILPHCAALVTTGEPDVLLTAITAACPALVLPQLPDQALRAHLWTRSGSGAALSPSVDTPEAIRDAVVALVEDDAYRVPLRRMRADMHGHPSAAEAAAAVRELV